MADSENIKKVILWLISQGIVDSQEQLAEKLGYNPSSVSQIVSGIKPLSHKFADKICSLSEKINKDYLFAESDNILIGDNNNHQSTHAGHNINGNGNKVNSETDKFLDLLRTRDEQLTKSQQQIDRLLSIIENNSKK